MDQPRSFQVVLHNPKKLTYGQYQMISAACDGAQMQIKDMSSAVLERSRIEMLPDHIHKIEITLDEI